MFEIGRLWRDRQQENVKSRKTSVAGKKDRARSRDGASGAGHIMTADFADALEEADARLADEDLELFMSEIMKQGERLKQNPNKKEFLRYKTMISRFLKRVVERSFKTGRTRRRDREYVFADIINEKLYELGHYLILEEAETVALAATIDEIKGLLYDSLQAARNGLPPA